MGNLAKQLRKKQDGMTNEGKRQDAISRLAALEARQDELAQAQNIFGAGVNKDMEGLFRMVNAISEILGVDQVAAKIKENQIKEMESNVAQSDINFAEAVSNGRLEIVEEVPNIQDDLNKIAICASINNKDGELIHPSKFYRGYATWNAEIQKGLVGKKIGDKLPLEDGGTMTVIQIYKDTGKPAEVTQ